jgi:hypothetical protein
MLLKLGANVNETEWGLPRYKSQAYVIVPYLLIGW